MLGTVPGLSYGTLSAMRLWRRIRGFLGFPVRTFADSPPRPIDSVILEMLGRGSEAKVSRSQALSVSAVQRGRNLICSIATLPLIQYGPEWRVVRNPLLEQLDPDVANVVTLAQTLEDLLFEGVSWWRITAFGWDGYPAFVRHLDFGTVSVDPPTGRSPSPLPSGLDPREGVVYVDGEAVGGREIIRFDSPNPGVLKVGARAIRRALLLDQAAALYADDPRPQDYFTPTENADPADDQDIEDILSDWKAARKARVTGYVPAALKYNTVDTPSPADLQLVELQKQAGLDLANALGVDPEDLGVSTTSRTYQNAVDRRRDKINDVLSPFMRAITDRLSMGDVTKRGHMVAFDLDDYMRANPTERWNVYKTAEEMGAITIDEIRDEERKPPIPPQQAQPPVVPDAPPVPDDQSVGATAPVPTGFIKLAASDEERQLQFADLPVHEFRVDRQRRIIEGLALPYGQVAGKYGLKFEFANGALKWTSVNRVKLLRDHDMSQAIGVATNLTHTSKGLQVRFKVARGDEGDRALELAEDGVLDGLSVGVDFDISTDTVPHPSKEGVLLVRRADLRETSLTAMPAFDDARVTKVAASRDNGRNAMDDCATCGQQHAPGACPTPQPPTNTPEPAGLQLSADQLQALLTRPGALQALVATPPAQPPPPEGAFTLSADQLDALIRSGGLGTLLGMPQLAPTPPPAPAPEERQTVNPTRRTVSVTATEEPIPYRFDREGNLTKGHTYDFSTDLISGSRGDSEALQRAQQFLLHMAPMFGGAQFDIDKADAAALNPNINRPDLYVDQKEFSYPIWDAINKGTLADATPFVLPKFNTSSGLVAAHVEGVEPTPGAVTATSQTITPSALSGKVEITREAWDQGGNPQLSGIIWRQMVRSWFEGLEAAAVALLDGLTPTGITLSTAATDDILVGELESAIAALQFVRGGMRMRDFFLQVDLYKALVNATDADGRKLIPRIGPVNTNGTVSDFFADLDLAGLRGRPGWALAASGTVAASSYLFDRNDVHGWASAPQRLEFQYRVAYVDVAIWGYKALANTDLTGVREVIYDPA